MTANQWRLLDILDTWGGMGTIEVEMQFGEYAPWGDSADSEKAEAEAYRTTRLVVANLMRSLVKKGLAVSTDGYDITEKGRELLARHKARQKN